MSSCTEQKVITDKNLEATIKQISANENYLYLVEETRVREQESFEAAGTAYQANKAAAVDAQNILQQIWAGSASFVQLARHANKMFLQPSKNNNVKLFVPIFAAFAQVSST